MTTKRDILLLSAILAWLLWSHCGCDGQSLVDIMPPANTNAVDVLDDSAVSLPTEPQPVTVSISWYNDPFDNTNIYDVIGLTLDGENWFTIYETQIQLTNSVTIINSNQFALYRVGFQNGP